MPVSPRQKRVQVSDFLGCEERANALTAELAARVGRALGHCNGRFETPVLEQLQKLSAQLQERVVAKCRLSLAAFALPAAAHDWPELLRVAVRSACAHGGATLRLCLHELTELNVAMAQPQGIVARKTISSICAEGAWCGQKAHGVAWSSHVSAISGLLHEAVSANTALRALCIEGRADSMFHAIERTAHGSSYFVAMHGITLEQCYTQPPDHTHSCASACQRTAAPLCTACTRRVLHVRPSGTIAGAELAPDAAEQLALPPQLRALCLSRVTLSEATARALHAPLARCAHLTALALPACDVHCTVIAALADVLQPLTGLRRLDLSCNPLAAHDDTSAPGQRGRPSANWILVRFPRHPVAMLLHAVQTLEDLDVSHTEMSHHFAAQFVGALPTLGSLRVRPCRLTIPLLIGGVHSTALSYLPRLTHVAHDKFLQWSEDASRCRCCARGA